MINATVAFLIQGKTLTLDVESSLKTEVLIVTYIGAGDLAPSSESARNNLTDLGGIREVSRLDDNRLLIVQEPGADTLYLLSEVARVVHQHCS